MDWGGATHWDMPHGAPISCLNRWSSKQWQLFATQVTLRLFLRLLNANVRQSALLSADMFIVFRLPRIRRCFALTFALKVLEQ
jgi:hypothetical protein